MSEFKEKLKKLRKEKGWSQDQLAEKIGIHGRHVGKYEIGKAMPNAETVVKIAKVFGISIDYLLMDKDDLSLKSRISDTKLLLAFESVDQMNPRNKEVIMTLIDAFIKKNQIETVLEK